MFSHIPSLIVMFQNAHRYAEAHDMGNEAAMFAKIIRDLDTIKTMPLEAYAGVVAGPTGATGATGPGATGPAAGPFVNTTQTLRRNTTVDRLGREDAHVRGATGATPGPLLSDAERGWTGTTGATGAAWSGSTGAAGSTGATGAIDGIGF